jgi:hypothetical protein
MGLMIAIPGLPTRAPAGAGLGEFNQQLK